MKHWQPWSEQSKTGIGRRVELQPRDIVSPDGSAARCGQRSEKARGDDGPVAWIGSDRQLVMGSADAVV